MIDYVLLIVVAFLAVCFIVGLLHSRGVHTFTKYAVGDKNFRTATLVATIIATNFGGGFLARELEQIYSNGLYYILPKLSGVIALLIMGQFMSLRMQEFLKHLSVAESMGSLFGSRIRVISAISGILRLSGGLAMQFSFTTTLFSASLNIDKHIAMILAVAIVLLYSVFGGIKSVTFTDVIQFTTFGMVIPVCVCLIGSHVHIVKLVPVLLTTHENFNLKHVITWSPKFKDALGLLLLGAMPGMHPAIMHRFYMTSNVWQAKRVFTYSALIALIIKVLVVLLGVLLLIDNPYLNPKELVLYIMGIHPYLWFKGLFLIGILALAMSTADSNLNTSSVLFSNDIVPFFKLFRQNKLLLARAFTGKGL